MSSTRKKGSKRSPKHITTFEWLRDPYEQLKRSTSFNGKEVSDEEFFRFFEEIGERNRTKSRSRSGSKTRKSPKSPKPKSPKPKSPRPNPKSKSK
jgi:hypothetical protein